MYRKNKIMFISALLLAVFFVVASLSGCKNTDTEPPSNESECKVENPLTDLDWLSQKISKFDSDSTRTVKVSQCKYQTDKTGFLIEPCVGCPDAGTELYDCKGNLLCVLLGETDDPCAEYEIDANSISLIYQHNKTHTPVNVTLYDKDYLTIQRYIQGKWKFLFAKGGITGNDIIYFDNLFQVFTNDNKIIRWNTVSQIRDTLSYFWQRYPKYFPDCDYVDIMCVFTPPHPPHQRFIFYMIQNDTLMYGDANLSEPFGYNLIKINE